MSKSSLISFVVCLSVVAVACGGAGASAGTPSAAATPSDAPRPRDLAKLDDSLRERLDRDERFPIRVKFVHRPSRSELESLLLVAVERDAVGNVDRETLQTIIARDDVAHVSRVDGAGYEDGGDLVPEGEAADDAAGDEDSFAD